MIRGYQAEISKIYGSIREEENKALRERKAEIEQKLPAIIELERQIGKLCIELSISSFKNMDNRDAYLKELKEKITEHRIKKSELLVANGYPMDYLNLHYRCPKCEDTGYIGSKKCICYKQKMVQIYYKNSELVSLLKTNNFENFNLNYYSTQRYSDAPESPRKNIQEILEKAFNFIKSFETTDENLMFYGNSGTGKTFLSHCIAKDLLDKGYLVVYRTSEELIQNLRQIRFNEDDGTLEDLLTNCDLLIIDDLGTEQVNDFSKTELFNLLNKKLLASKKMIVSTNFTLEDLSRTYSERITSRLFGSFNLCKFYGEDIRVKKNLSRLR
ncbi:MAG: ATP-binding protein [Bacillota bacterium]|nr:ATP-binding protein [Bacillota bacterium]